MSANDISRDSCSTILIVDDHHLIRKTLQEWLAKQFPSKEFVEAGSGEDALEKFHQYMPGIVLMDIHLPGISGIDAIKKIKAECPETRIIMLTVQEDKRYRLKANEAGADAYVVKREMYSQLVPLINTFNGYRTTQSEDLAN
jgi:DNA-binding NarL/FixJ family response regulator